MRENKSSLILEMIVEIETTKTEEIIKTITANVDKSTRRRAHTKRALTRRRDLESIRRRNQLKNNPSLKRKPSRITTISLA